MITYKQLPELAYNHTDKLQIIEIEIPEAGKETSFDVETPTGMHEIIGVAMINPNPKAAGHGTLRLRIGDEEILPVNFHADMAAKFESRFVDTKLNFGFKHHIFPVKVKAGGRPAKITYTEPSDGGTGKLYLYLLGTKGSNNLTIPKFRFQVFEMTVPKGVYSSDVEIAINEKTLQSHEKVVGAVFLGQANRVKEASLKIDGTTIFPDGMASPLICKELSTSHSIAGGIFTKHIMPLPFMLHPCSVKAKNSKIEGKVVATPNPDRDYKIYLYLLTIA